jgi:outer membrane receptor for ferrienterochelin and colicins
MLKLRDGSPPQRRDRRKDRKVRVLAAGLLASSAPAALAQVAETTPVPPTPVPAATAQVYEPAFFSRFAPSSALDMVSQIPGFSLDGGDSDKRGFGQGGANVLINGRRISGKSGGTIDALSRVTTDAVVRIEIVDGASLSLPGLSGQVANVITRPKGLSGQYRWNPQARGDAKPVYLRGDASISAESGPLAWTLGAHVYGGFGSATGPEVVTDGAGLVTDLRDETGGGGGREPGFNGSLTWSGRNGDVFNINGTMNFPDFSDTEESIRSGPGQTDRYRLFQSDFEAAAGELGADYEFDLAGGRLKLIGLMRGEEGEEFDQVTQTYADLRPATGGRSFVDFTSGESIARAEYGFPSGGAGDWQAALEGAFNFLDITTLEEELQPTGEFTPDGPLSHTRIEEQRAEASLSYSRKLAPGLDLQATFAGEYSELSQSGDNVTTRDFVRPKGSISLAWAATPDTDINLRLTRDVGQLDFGDFASSTNRDQGTSQSGNIDLVPEQSWQLEAELNRRLGDWGAIKFTAFAAEIEDVVDQIPIGFCDDVRVSGPSACAAPGVFALEEGVGNIDSAESYGLSLGGTLNFDPAGFEGARLEFEIEFGESRVTDPFTGRDRRISNTDISEFEASFRHDVPGTDWAWGFGHERFLDGAGYSKNHRTQFRVDPGYTFYFIEHKDVLGAKVWFQYLPSGPSATFSTSTAAAPSTSTNSATASSPTSSASKSPAPSS